jgi:hypothetical protein
MLIRNEAFPGQPGKPGSGQWAVGSGQNSGNAEAYAPGTVAWTFLSMPAPWMRGLR